MSFSQSGSTILFNADNLAGNQTTLFPDLGNTTLAQLSDGSVAFGWTTTLPGIIEMFSPVSGAETATNVVLGDLYSAFGGQFYEDVSSIGIAPLSGGGFVAAYQKDVSIGSFQFDSQAFFQVYSNTGAPVGTITTFDDTTSLRFPDNPSITATSSGFLLSREISNNDFQLNFYSTSAGISQINAPVMLFDVEFYDTALLSNGNTLVVSKSDFVSQAAENIWYIDLYDGSANAIGPAIAVTVNANPGETISNVAVKDVTADPDGGFAVLYTVSSNVPGQGFVTRAYVELFNNDGTTHRSVFSPREIDMNGIAITNNTRFEVVPLQGDGYAVIYEIDGPQERDIFGVVYDAAEAKVGQVLQLTDDTIGEQENMSALLLSDGRLALGYTDDDDRGLGDAQVKIFDVSTVPPVNQGTSGDDDLSGTEGADRWDLGDGNDRFLALGGDDYVNGADGNDTLDGGAGNDELLGGADDDTLIGGPGADILDGGTGVDTASYAGYVGPRLVVDMIQPARNTGDAAGDTYISIENLTGSDGRDILGHSLAGGRIEAGDARDVIFARGGDDQLFGQGGNDILLGGTGADLIDGGTGTDRAQYSQARTGVKVDMQNTALNTGEAAGDVFVSIEDVFGSAHDDELFGDAGGNVLFGGDGVDRLTGRGGDDDLFGGAGADILSGGAGNDLLVGGASIDTFIYDGGADVVQGWRLDRLRLDKDLWGGTDLSKTQILSFASVVGNATVFDFGGGDTLTLTGHTDIAALENWVSGF